MIVGDRDKGKNVKTYLKACKLYILYLKKYKL